MAVGVPVFRKLGERPRINIVSNRSDDASGELWVCPIHPCIEDGNSDAVSVHPLFSRAWNSDCREVPEVRSCNRGLVGFGEPLWIDEVECPVSQVGKLWSNASEFCDLFGFRLEDTDAGDSGRGASVAYSVDLSSL